MMRFDIAGMGGAVSSNGSLDAILDEARLVEASGFDGYWGSDHQYAMVDRFQDTLDRYIVLAAVAGVTRRIRIGPLVTGNTYRHPVLLAKQATSVDLLSGGRLDLGIGTGWTKPEHDAYGIPFPPFAERLERLDETLTILKLLWTQRESSFEGKHYRLQAAPFEPKPVQVPHPPRVVGGFSHGLLRIVARNADEWTAGTGSPRFLEAKLRLLEQCCAEVGRAASQIPRSTMVHAKVLDDPADVERYRDWYIAREQRRAAGGLTQKIKWMLPDEDPWDAIWNMTLVGPPDRIIVGLNRLCDLGFNRVIFSTSDPSTIRRLGEEVLPAFAT